MHQSPLHRPRRLAGRDARRRAATAVAFANNASPSPPPSQAPTPTTPTPTQPSGNCAAAWVSTTAYVSGNVVSHNGGNWTANQWNYDEVPGGPSGAWNNDGPC